MKNSPAYIEIVQENHVYTATVCSLADLERYCSDLVEQGKQFRFGSIVSYGTFSDRIQALVFTMRRIENFGTYNRKLKYVS